MSEAKFDWKGAAGRAGWVLLLPALFLWIRFGTEGSLAHVEVRSKGTIDVPVYSFDQGQQQVAGYDRQVTITVTGHDRCLRGMRPFGDDLDVGDRLEFVRYFGCAEGPCDCVLEHRKTTRGGGADAGAGTRPTP